MADNSVMGSTDTIASDDIGGVKHQRVKVEYGADGSATDVAPGTPLPVFPNNTGRTFINFYANGVAAGTNGTETAITLVKSAAAGSATSSAVSHVITSGKRFRIVQITFASRGHATATAQISTFSIRVNTSGATTTTSNTWIAGRVATPATANAWDRLQLFFDDMGMELVGDGTLTFGVTAAAAYTTNAPTWDVIITGYEYTP